MKRAIEPDSPQAKLAERVRLVLVELAEGRPVREVRMFGSLAFMVDEKMAVAASKDGSLLVRVAPANYDSLLDRGAQPAFMGPDRPMGQGWLTVAGDLLESDQELAYWTDVGIDSRNYAR